MGDSRSKIYEDECDWDDFRNKHNLTVKGDCYSMVATHAYKAASMGLSGNQIEKYVEAALNADTLRKQAEDLMKPFEKLALALKEINN